MPPVQPTAIQRASVFVLLPTARSGRHLQQFRIQIDTFGKDCFVGRAEQIGHDFGNGFAPATAYVFRIATFQVQAKLGRGPAAAGQEERSAEDNRPRHRSDHHGRKWSTGRRTRSGQDGESQRYLSNVDGEILIVPRSLTPGLISISKRPLGHSCVSR